MRLTQIIVERADLEAYLKFRIQRLQTESKTLHKKLEMKDRDRIYQRYMAKIKELQLMKKRIKTGASLREAGIEEYRENKYLQRGIKK